MRKFCFRRLIPIFATAGILLLCSACGGAGRPTVSQRITGVDGGTVSVGDAITVQIPAGALSEDASVAITEESEKSRPPAGPEAAQSVGSAFRIELGGQELAKPLALEIAFAPELLPEGAPEDVVFLAYYDDSSQEWVPVGGRVDKDRHVIIVETDHLSWWNPFTWNWDAWIAVLHSTLSLRLTDFLEARTLLTEVCNERGEHVTVDNSKANSVIQGCVTTDHPTSPELRVVNLKSFYVGLSPAPGGPGYPEPTILGPGDAATFTASTNDSPPATVYADFTDAAMWRFVVGLVAEMLPGGDLIPNDGVTYIADGLAMVFSAQEASEALDAGDARGAAEHIYELITGDSFIETFVQLAAEYGQEHGVDMMSKWTASGIKQVLKAVAAVDVIISATDFIANYMFNNHSAVAFSWTHAAPTPAPAHAPTPPPTPAPPGATLDLAATDYALESCVADFRGDGFTGNPATSLSGTLVFERHGGLTGENISTDEVPAEVRDLRAESTAYGLSAADVANGVQWEGEVDIPWIYRYQRADGSWSAWEDDHAPFQVKSVNGAWQREWGGGGFAIGVMFVNATGLCTEDLFFRVWEDRYGLQR